MSNVIKLAMGLSLVAVVAACERPRAAAVHAQPGAVTTQPTYDKYGAVISHGRAGAHTGAVGAQTGAVEVDTDNDNDFDD